MSDQTQNARSKTLNPAVLQAVGSIGQALSGLSNKERQQALSMVAALSNLRVVSMDRPIGGNSSTSAGPGPAKEKTPGKGPTPSAAWKKSQAWRDAEIRHAQLVETVKAAPANRREDALTRLRESESAMKALKQQLRGASE